MPAHSVSCLSAGNGATGAGGRECCGTVEKAASAGRETGAAGVWPAGEAGEMEGVSGTAGAGRGSVFSACFSGRGVFCGLSSYFRMFSRVSTGLPERITSQMAVNRAGVFQAAGGVSAGMPSSAWAAETEQKRDSARRTGRNRRNINPDRTDAKSAW